MIKREKSFFDLATMVSKQERKKKFFFTDSLRSLRHDQERKKFFSFSHYVHQRRNKHVLFNLTTTITTP